MELYHGTHNGLMGTDAAHEGMCWTEIEDSAEQFAGSRGTVYSCDCPDDWNYEPVDGYDHDENDAPADSDAFRAAHAARGIDVLVYDDEDETGQTLTCYRVISDRAVAYLREHMQDVDE